MSDLALEMKGITRTFHQGGRELSVLREANMFLGRGEIIALVGPSGAGKSTLLHIAGLLERPDSGEVVIAGENCSGLPDSERTRLRRETLGFVYQFHHLLPDFTALENVLLPQMIAGLRPSEGRIRALELLDMMGLEGRVGHRPAELSGGEQQRVAIARALANAPRVILADEPTGNLDQETGQRIARQLIRIIHGTQVGALIATHNPDIAALMDRTVRLDQGRLVEG